MATNIITNEASSIIKYSGKISAIIKDKKGKIVSKRNFHNAGSNYLFKFLSYCIAGKYQAAENFRPKYIRLMSYNSINEPSIDSFDINDFTAASNLVLMNTSATPKETDNSWSTILHFTIPFAFLQKEKIQAACLYCESEKNTLGNYSAVAYFTKLDDQGKEILDQIVTGDEFENYNLIIEWDLSVGNFENQGE